MVEFPNLADFFRLSWIPFDFLEFEATFCNFVNCFVRPENSEFSITWVNSALCCLQSLTDHQGPISDPRHCHGPVVGCMQFSLMPM